MRPLCALVIASLAGCGARTSLSITATDASTDAPALHRVGLVFASTTRPGLSGPEDVTAVFSRDPIPLACADVGPRGSCALVTCPTSMTALSSIDGGPIALSVGSQTTSMAYDAANGRYPGASLNFAFTTGDTIRVQGGGASGVPAYDLSTTAPNLVELDPPWFTRRMTITTTSDLRLSWGDAPTGDAIFHLSDASGHVLVCFFDASPRSGVVPRAQLSAFRAVAAGTVNASFYVADRASIDRGDWTIAASTITWYGASWSQGGEVTLE
jgi:hypothetical protein